MKAHERHRSRLREAFRRAASPRLSGDGCTYSPDGWIVGAGARARYVDIAGPCCEPHDIAYRVGGREGDRLLADQKLRICIACKIGRVRAWAYYQAVRLCGRDRFNYRRGRLP